MKLDPALCDGRSRWPGRDVVVLRVGLFDPLAMGKEMGTPGQARGDEMAKGAREWGRGSNLSPLVIANDATRQSMARPRGVSLPLFWVETVGHRLPRLLRRLAMTRRKG